MNCSSIYEQPDNPIVYLHRHNAVEIGYCHRGSGIWIVEDKIMPFGTGDVIFISEEETHLAQSRRGTTSQWTWIHCDPLRLFATTANDLAAADTSSLQGKGFRNLFPASKFPRLNGTVRDVIEEFKKKPMGYREAVRSLLHLVFVLVHRHAVEGGVPASPVAGGRPAGRGDWERVYPAVQWVCNTYPEPIAVEDLARRCAMSVTNFRRVFTRAAGRGPREYLLSIRIRMASVELRATSARVARIAMDCGFPTLSAFNRKFRECMGTTPREWRKAAGRMS